MSSLHHVHVRKRMYKLLEPYPHPVALKRLLDRIMVFIAIVGPLATLPQVFQVFTTRDATGLSLATWLIWVILSALWALYGVVHKEMPILISNVIYVVLQGAVVLAILIYN